MTVHQARTLVSGDLVEWIDGAGGCSGAVGTVGFDCKAFSSYVDWPDGQRTFLNDGAALLCMRVFQEVGTVNGFPR
jgi:hypothetical protein